MFSRAEWAPGAGRLFSRAEWAPGTGRLCSPELTVQRSEEVILGLKMS
jgi:hypothetical protein